MVSPVGSPVVSPEVVPCVALALAEAIVAIKVSSVAGPVEVPTVEVGDVSPLSPLTPVVADDVIGVSPLHATTTLRQATAPYIQKLLRIYYPPSLQRASHHDAGAASLKSRANDHGGAGFWPWR